MSHCREKGGAGDFAEIRCEQPLQCLDKAAGKIVVNTQSHQQREHQRHHNCHGALNAGGHTGIDDRAHDHIADQSPYHHRLVVRQQTRKSGFGDCRIKISKPCEQRAAQIPEHPAHNNSVGNRNGIGSDHAQAANDFPAIAPARFVGNGGHGGRRAATTSPAHQQLSHQAGNANRHGAQ